MGKTPNPRSYQICKAVAESSDWTLQVLQHILHGPAKYLWNYIHKKPDGS